MDRYASLFEVARLLLCEEDPDRTADTIFRRVLEVCAADRGFIVVREGRGYEQKYQFGFDEAGASTEERRFSRSLVRRAIETREMLLSQDVLADPRFAQQESVERIGAGAVLVVPLHHQTEVYGVVYLEQTAARGGFPSDGVGFLSDFAELAGLFIRRAIEREGLRRHARSLERGLFAKHDFEGIVTRDPAMLELLKQVAQIAESDATVLVRGETGTGKELIARALHVNSRRAQRPLVTLHCTALPTTILESELFGHVRGAFTGAERDRPGRIAAAHGGTLFLDEVAEIPPELQAKLLRFLQFGEIQRIGADRTEKVDVRVIAATHRDLKSAVETGAFRRDLYYRLNVIELELPPLRDRRSDIALLVEAFLKRYWKRTDARPRFTPRALSRLQQYDYPGNIRELAHAVERACVLARRGDLDVDLLPPDMLEASPRPGPSDAPPAAPPPPDASGAFTQADLDVLREAAVARTERAFLSGLLERHQGNISLAARESGIHRSYLQRLLSKHGLRHG